MAESTQSMLESLVQQLQATRTDEPSANAVSLKLPPFWIRSPEIWFAKVEAQFGTKNVTKDQTKYDHVVSSLDFETAEEIQAILTNPPIENKYDKLKSSLIKTFGKSQSQKDTELLSLNGLGDKRPTALLRKINALNDDPQTLKRALFLLNIPSEVRSILAGHHILDLEELAEAADRIWETSSSNRGINSFEQDNTVVEAVTHTSTRGKQYQKPSTYKPHRSSGTPGTPPPSSPQPFVCFYHTKYGPEARRCQPGCSFSSLPKPQQQSGNGKASR